MKEYKLIANSIPTGDFVSTWCQPSDDMAMEYAKKIVRFFQPCRPFETFYLWCGDRHVGALHIANVIEVTFS